MCEYSLHTIPNRLAAEGERLITYRFHTATIGLASAAEIEEVTLVQLERKRSRSWWSTVKSWLNPPEPVSGVCAVCIPPGARLRVSHLSKYTRRDHCLGPVEEATFTELHDDAYQFRDAIVFRNGRSELLQHLDEGVRFEVLSLGSKEPDPSWAESPTERQRREA